MDKPDLDYQYPVLGYGPYQEYCSAFALTRNGRWVERGQGDINETAVADLVGQLMKRVKHAKSTKYRRELMRHAERALMRFFGDTE